MKKILFTLALLLVVSNSYSQKLFNVGIKAGYNSSLSFSSIGPDITYNHSNVFKEIGNNFHIGAFGRVNFGKIYVQPELLFSRQKQNYVLDDSNNTGLYNHNVKIKTIDVPILLGYKLLDFKVASLRAVAGPKFRFDAGSSVNFKHLIDGELQNVFPTADIKSAKVGLDLGLTLDVLMLTFDVRYNIIGNMYETSLKDIGKNKIPSSTFTFALGWKIL